MYKFLLPAVVCSYVFAAHADNAAPSSDWYVTPTAGYYFLDDDGNIDDMPAMGVNLGYQVLPSWAVEFSVMSGSGETYFGADADLLHLQIDALHVFDHQGGWQPFALAGIGNLSFDVDKKRSETIPSAGMGSFYKVNEQIQLRGDTRLQYSIDDRLVDTVVSLGVQFRFGSSRSKVEPVPLHEEIRVMHFEIHFESSSSALLAEYEDDVAQLAEFMTTYPDTQLQVTGFADGTGSAAFNLNLSKQRAQTVINKLASEYGIDAARLSAVGRGQAEPIASNRTEEGRRLNRRDIAIIKAHVWTK